jgi:predicted ester cyclase
MFTIFNIDVNDRMEDPVRTNADVFARVIEEGFNRGNFDAWDDCFADPIIEHQYGLPSALAEFKQAIRGLRAAFPDLHLTIEDSVAHGDKEWVRMSATGTHQAPFFGVAPTGVRFTITVIDVCRFENGRIVEHWGVPDRFALMDQIGALPRRAPAPAPAR